MQISRIAALAAVLPLAATAAAGAADERLILRGTVVAFTPATVTVKTASGPVEVAYTPKTLFVGDEAASIADIVPGAFLGIANVPEGATSRALEVSVFDEKLRGVGEGDGPWEAPGAAHSMMTNGTVAKPRSMMTNGTVGALKDGAVKTITVAYKGGQRVITVTKATPVVKVVPGDAKLLANDASVFISARKTDAGTVAGFIVVGKNGTVVPL